MVDGGEHWIDADADGDEKGEREEWRCYRKHSRLYNGFNYEDLLGQL